MDGTLGIYRHCEEHLRRSNPSFLLRGEMDCFASLAMTVFIGSSLNPPAGAPDFTSLYTTESISAWNEASMILGGTPLVVQRCPPPSSLSSKPPLTPSCA